MYNRFLQLEKRSFSINRQASFRLNVQQLDRMLSTVIATEAIGFSITVNGGYIL